MSKSKYNGRKLVGGILLIILATSVVFFGDLTVPMFDSWGNFILLIYATYVTGNVGTKYVKQRIENKDKKK